MHLVFLHGGPAAGKLTVARALEDQVGYPVFHNHLVVDLLTTVFPFGSEPFVRLREQFWMSVTSDAARAGRSLVFTFTTDATVTPGFPDAMARLVNEAGGHVHFVRLLVGAGEQERRLGSPDRARFHKLTSVETLRRLRSSPVAGEQPPVDLEIDTEEVEPERAATMVVERFRLVPQAPVGRYPAV